MRWRTEKWLYNVTSFEPGLLGLMPSVCYCQLQDFKTSKDHIRSDQIHRYYFLKKGHDGNTSKMFGEFWGCLAASGCCVAKMKARKKSADLYINYIMTLISKNTYLLLYHKILIYILSRQQSDASANFSRFWQLVETKGLLTHDDTCFGGKGWKAPPQGGKPPQVGPP